MTTKEKLNKAAEEREFEAKMIKAYAEIVEWLEQRRFSWYGAQTSFSYTEEGSEDVQAEIPMDGCEAEWEAYTKVIEAIVKLAK